MSDSSSDESDERLREAAVTVQDIFAKNPGQKKPQESVQENNDATKDTGTTITDLSAECRQFLAKSLSNNLDNIQIPNRGSAHEGVLVLWCLNQENQDS
ncbi:uncharacterized protein LOC142575686 isoform X2 [Dermacentor variabilis]|uniref:uncharacterized protein LOC142575686 isoform X2 n=1 Tax=Dermacentor variabilis TaxID=34621 RepID=UPI003F5C31F8